MHWRRANPPALCSPIVKQSVVAPKVMSGHEEPGFLEKFLHISLSVVEVEDQRVMLSQSGSPGSIMFQFAVWLCFMRECHCYAILLKNIKVDGSSSNTSHLIETPVLLQHSYDNTTKKLW